METTTKEKWHEFVERMRHPFSYEETELKKTTKEEHGTKMEEHEVDKSTGSEFIDEK